MEDNTTVIAEPQTYEPPRSALSFSRRRARHSTPHEIIKSEPQTYEPPRGALSFSRRRARQRTPHEMIKLQVGPMITSQSVPGQNIVLVRPRTLGQTNPKEHNDLVPMEGDEEIFEEEAACKFCFVVLKKENILKTECKCSNPSSMKNVHLNGQEQEVTTIVILVDKWFRLFLLLWLEG
ncbi:unnamed protein product [Camellia sinensis]